MKTWARLLSWTLVVGSVSVGQSGKGDLLRLDEAYLMPNTLLFHAEGFRVFADELFANADKEFIGSAVRNLHEILQDNESREAVVTCAFERSQHGIPESREEFELQLDRAFGFNQTPQNIVDLYIARISNERLSVARAPVGESNARLNLLRIAMNTDFLGNASTYAFKNDIGYWSGVIAHEVLHNFGHSHPKNDEGYFVSTFGDCVWLTSQDGAN
jgi:hypothetical protein